MKAFAAGPGWPLAEGGDPFAKWAADQAAQQQRIKLIKAETLRVVRISREMQRTAAEARQQTAELRAAMERRAAMRRG
jgi:hypothetical protein